MSLLPVLRAFLVCSFALPAAAQDWPGLRGPRHDGAASGRLAPGAGAGFAVAWRSALGAGYSSVAVAGGRAVTMFSDGRSDVTVAFDAQSGRELWRYAIAPTLPGKDGSFDGPIATPVVAGERVFGLGPRGHLFALDAASGRELWKLDLAAREQAPAPHYGYAASPLLAGETLVVPIGAKGGGAIAGFDLATGARRWRLGDDAVNYQVPVVVSLNGRDRVVATGDTRLFLIDPASGRVLLDYAYGGESHPMANESLVPVPAGEGRLFLKHRMDASTMLRLAGEGDEPVRVEVLWSAPVLRQSYVVPVYHDGHLYGMSGRMTLTCVDAATGTQRWRSREPGDGFPMLVGGDLVVLTKEGTLHVAAASPEGWQERARIPLFAGGVWSPPGFAEGAVFARGQQEIARVDWWASTAAADASPTATLEASPKPASTVPSPASRRFAGFLRELAGVPVEGKAAAVDRFLAGLPAGPLVEWPDRVVFLYRGPGSDVGIAGDMNGDRREDPMWRATGTDLFWYEATLEPDARVNYHFVVDFEKRVPDSRNPSLVPAPRTGTLGVFPSEQSSLAMPGFRTPDYLGEVEPARRGTLAQHVVESASWPGAKITLHVYVPASRDTRSERLPLALVVDGDGAREAGLVPRALDNLIPGRVAPLVVAFLGATDWGAKKPSSNEEGLEAFAELVTRDVVGFLESRFRTDSAPDRRAVVGSGFTAYVAADLAFRRPGSFGALGLQSIIMLDTDDELLRKRATSATATPLRIYLDWSRYDRRATRERWDMGAANARFAAFLRERGYRPAGGETPEGAGWAGWRHRTDRLFGSLFPPVAEASAARPASP